MVEVGPGEAPGAAVELSLEEQEPGKAGKGGASHIWGAGASKRRCKELEWTLTCLANPSFKVCLDKELGHSMRSAYR